MNSLTPMIRVLLIEDSPTDADLIVLSLEEVKSATFSVTWVETLGDGLEQLAASQREGSGFDVVLLDLSLPDSYGIETCIKAHHHSPSVPIIVLTGVDDDAMALAAVKTGAQDYLVKGPVDGRLLSRAIRYAIERNTAQELKRQADERVRLMTSQLPVEIWTTDFELSFTPPTARFCMCESGHTSLAGQRLFDMLGHCGQSGRSVIAAHQKALSGESVSFDVRWSKKTISMHVEPLRDAANNIVGTIGISLDVTHQKRMQDELNAARHVQQALFPSSAPVVPGFEIAGAVFPAEETAGDYFDFIPLPNGAMGLVVGDVTGHGLGPAMLMTELRAYLRAVATCDTDPVSTLIAANRFLSTDMDENRYVTLFYATLDSRSRRVRFAAAGHCAYVLRANGETLLLESTGLPLGLFDEMKLTEGPSFELAPGDIFYLPTDGFQEAARPDRHMFGLDRSLEFIRRHRHCTAAETIRGLRAEIQNFTGTDMLADDMTAIIVRCLEHPADSGICKA